MKAYSQRCRWHEADVPLCMRLFFDFVGWRGPLAPGHLRSSSFRSRNVGPVARSYQLLTEALSDIFLPIMMSAFWG